MSDSVRKNIILIGMPTSGKSTVGVIVAKVLGYGFVDADIEIQNKDGRKLSKIIEGEGSLEDVVKDVLAAIDEFS